MINKKLLSEILNIEEICEYRESVNIIWVADAMSCCGLIAYNIAELEKKCLRWAWEKGYSFDIIPFCVSVVNLKTNEEKTFRYTKEDMLNKVPFLSKYTFEASEWIFNNIKGV